jgi:hypothetical protein
MGDDEDVGDKAKDIMWNMRDVYEITKRSGPGVYRSSRRWIRCTIM